MVGQPARSAAKARPTIIIHCRNVDCCHRAVKIVRHSELWGNFLSGYPAFQLMSCDRPPRPLAQDPLEQINEQSDEVYIKTGLASHTFANPIFFKLTTESGVVDFRRATMGGTVLVDGKARGLTVSHACHTAPFDESGGSADEDEVESIWSDSEEEQNVSDGEDDVGFSDAGMRPHSTSHEPSPRASFEAKFSPADFWHAREKTAKLSPISPHLATSNVGQTR